jgi:hypothetical protein
MRIAAHIGTDECGVENTDRVGRILEMRPICRFGSERRARYRSGQRVFYATSADDTARSVRVPRRIQ